jgi:hypothetical protein
VRLSYIVTTASGDPAVAHQHGGGGIYAATLADRATLLREKILPATEGFDEVWVVGRYPQDLEDDFSDHVNFVHLAPLRRERIEAFRQREVGARFSTGDILVMSADDHALGKGFAKNLRKIVDEDWDLLTPRRVHALTGETLNNGSAEMYSPWHCQVYKRHVWAQVPFTSFDTLWVDILLTQKWFDDNEIDCKMVWDDRLEVLDVEAREDER